VSRRPSPATTPAPAKATRRPRGAPRRLLLAAARDLFARQDYRATTTLEIAAHAGVAEHLLFRNFGSKAALFREALVVPFIDFVDEFGTKWRTIVPETAVEDEVGGDFVGALYDVFLENRGLLKTLANVDVLSDAELAECGIQDIGRAMAILGRIGAEGIGIRGMHSKHHELAARSTVAMVAGMAAFGTTFFSGRPPSRREIVDELTQMSLHGFLHRDG